MSSPFPLFPSSVIVSTDRLAVRQRPGFGVIENDSTGPPASLERRVQKLGKNAEIWVSSHQRSEDARGRQKGLLF
jgi:hypothetical protein